MVMRRVLDQSRVFECELLFAVLASQLIPALCGFPLPVRDLF
jgi:hypothetical protein